MGIRVRGINRIGKGRYVTSSWKLSGYLFARVIYWIFIFPIYAFFKYCVYIPIKWIIEKLFKKQ